MAPIQKAAWSRKTFEYGTWGGELHPDFEPKPGDVVAQEHWCSSGFANTDLDLLLKKHGIQRLIVMGLIAHTCVEATVRFAAELGYDVTMVRDATTSYSDAEMHAALDINIPNYASAILTTDDFGPTSIEEMTRRNRALASISPRRWLWRMSANSLISSASSPSASCCLEPRARKE